MYPLILIWLSVSFSNGISVFAFFLCFKCNHVQTLTRTFAYVLTLVNDELQALLMENLWSSCIIVPKKARIRVFVLLRNKVGPLGMGLGLARPSPNRPGPIYQLGPRLAQAQKRPKGCWPKLALGRIFLAQPQPKKMLGRTSGPKWSKSGPSDMI